MSSIGITLQCQLIAGTKCLLSNRLLHSRAVLLLRWTCFAYWTASSRLLQARWAPSMVSKTGRPIFAATLARLLTLSVHSGVVPQQWQRACITPIPKVAHPAEASDYRPISVTPVLSRLLERHTVKSYIYPALQQPPTWIPFC